MKNLYSTTALLLALSIASAPFTYANAHEKDGHNGVPSYLEGAIAKLPKKDAAQFRNTMQQAHKKNMAIANQIHMLHDELDAILIAEPFDKEAFRAKSKELRQVYETMRANMDDAFAAAAAQLSQEERKELVAAMAYPHTKHNGPKTAE